VRGVVNGWYSITPNMQLSGVWTVRSGRAYGAVASGLDLNGDGNFGDRTPTFGRNSFRAFGTNSVDLRFQYQVPMGKERKLQFYLESFNVTNRMNVRTAFTDYGRTPGQPNAIWLTPSTYQPPREVQLGIRFQF
jgi:hypothetical protein